MSLLLAATYPIVRILVVRIFDAANNLQPVLVLIDALNATHKATLERLLYLFPEGVFSGHIDPYGVKLCPFHRKEIAV